MKQRTVFDTSGKLRYVRRHTITHAVTARIKTSCQSFSLTLLGMGLLVSSATTYGQAVSLGEASNFTIVSSQGVTNDGLSIVNGNIALSPLITITGFDFSTPAGGGVVNGVVHYNDATAALAQSDALTAYQMLASLPYIPANNLTGQDLGGMTLTPGVYHFNTSAGLTGALTLDTGADPNAAFVFQIGSTLTTATTSSVIVSGAGAGITPNIFWQVGSSATLNTGSIFNGSILAMASVSFGTGSSLELGRAVALNGAVTLLGNSVSAPSMVLAAPGRYWNGSNGNLWSGMNWSTTDAGTDEVILGTDVDAVFSVSANPQNQNTNLDVDVTISSLTINDPAAVTIDGTNKLTISNSGLINGIRVNNGAGLTTIGSPLELGYLSQVISVNNASGMVINGVISGSNGLTKTGSGSLTITAAELYTGPTLISNGILQLGNGILAGSSIATSNSVVIGEEGTFSLNLADEETFENSVINNGEIRWIAQGQNTQASTSVFSGSGRMLVTSPGTTVLLGDNTFSGGTTIDTEGDVLLGNLLANDSSPLGTGELTIQSGRVDTFQSQLLQIDVGGYVQTGGEIAMHLQGTTVGTYTRYNVADQTDLSGGTVFVYDLSGEYVPSGGDTQNIIRSLGEPVVIMPPPILPEFLPLAAGSLVGQFASNTPESHFYHAASNSYFFYHQGDTLLYPTLTYDADNAYVTWVQDSFRSLPDLTPNQDAVGGGLDGYVAENAPLPDDVVAYLNGQNVADLPAMYDLIAPDELTAIFQMGFTAANIQYTNVQRHLDRVRRGSTTTTTSSRSSRDSKGGFAEESVTSQEMNRWSFFFEGLDGSARVDGDRNASGYRFDSTGGVVGADMHVSESLVIGLLGSYFDSDARLANGGRIDAESYSLAAYATMYENGYFLDALIGGGYNSYDTRRSSLLGFAEGSPDGWQLNSMLNTGYDFRSGNWTLTPNASVAYTRVTLDQFEETGSLSPLSYPRQHQESLRSEIGATIAYDIPFNGMIFTPQARLAWQHEFMDSTQHMESRFVGGTGPTFGVSGPHMDRDRIVISAGFSAQISNSVTIYAFYDGLLGSSDYQADQMTAGIQISF